MRIFGVPVFYILLILKPFFQACRNTSIVSISAFHLETFILSLFKYLFCGVLGLHCWENFSLVAARRLLSCAAADLTAVKLLWLNTGSRQRGLLELRHVGSGTVASGSPAQAEWLGPKGFSCSEVCGILPEKEADLCLLPYPWWLVIPCITTEPQGRPRFSFYTVQQQSKRLLHLMALAVWTEL